MDEVYTDRLRRRREEILSKMDAALSKSGRSFADVDMVAVSKTVGAPEVAAAIEVGFRRFGENRPQELIRKLEALRGHPGFGHIGFDMIGNLQTNKVNAVLGRVGLIHSISSLHLAEAVSARAERRIGEGLLARPQDILLEVNVSGEETKSGFSVPELLDAMPRIKELCGIHPKGLMTMAPRGNKAIARKAFSDLRELRDRLVHDDPDLELIELSCGMSEDFEIALEEGSTLVRLGRVVFDPAFAVE
ncbi:MAG: YggS family pyridoxal phosphate-dependent enzyme [Collinsella sp.]|nr:YggS family pyridoxal phosphate-dependent enzyme [Collinsella sp.]